MSGRAARVAPLLLASLGALVSAGAPAAAGTAPPGTGERGEFRAKFFERYIGKPAPPFTLKDRGGRPVSLADFRGKVVLLNFWFSACLPCRAETPDLIKLHNQYKDRGLAVLGINTDRLVMGEGQEMLLERFLKTFPIPYPVLMADSTMYRAYGNAPVQPISFLVDRAGRVAQIFWGASPGAAFERAVLPHLPRGPADPIQPGRKSGL
jgi:peroxiredoxin